MTNKLFPPPHKIAIAPGGGYLYGWWLTLLMLIYLAAAVLVEGVLVPVWSFFHSTIGGALVAGQYLGYALFGHVRYDDLSAAQWMGQGVGAKIMNKTKGDAQSR